jgi:IS605 OrfB family transposase
MQERFYESGSCVQKNCAITGVHPKGVRQNHAVIVPGDLHTRSMTASAVGTVEQPGRKVKQKSRLNRAILRQGWGELGRQLEYKQSWAGGLVEYQSEAYSSQQCPACVYSSALTARRKKGFSVSGQLAAFQGMRMR